MFLMKSLLSAHIKVSEISAIFNVNIFDGIYFNIHTEKYKNTVNTIL